MTEILPAYSPDIPDGFVFIAQDDADVAAIVEAAGDRVAEIIARPGYGFIVPADIAGTAGATVVETIAAEDVAPEPVPEPAEDPAPEPEPDPADTSAKGSK